MLRRARFALPFGAEARVLAALIRRDSGGRPVDGARLADAAGFHNVVGFVLEAVDEHWLVLPRPVVAALEERHARDVLRSAVLRRALPEVAAACCDAPVLLKGPAVSDRLYADPALRPFTDLDLLVPRDRLEAATAALVRAGFEPLVEFGPGFGARHGHDVHLVRGSGAGRVDVELHWRVGDDRVGEALSCERLRATAHDLGGVLVPAPPEQLLVLAVHLLGDRAKRLDWIHDLALAQRAATDEEWRHTFALARELGLLWVLHRALDYADELFGGRRERPLGAGAPPPFGPLRAAEELDLRAATHVGRLAALPWRDRPRYLREVLAPTRAGLRGTVGRDGTRGWKLVARHVGRVLGGLAPRG